MCPSHVRFLCKNGGVEGVEVGLLDDGEAVEGGEMASSDPTSPTSLVSSTGGSGPRPVSGKQVCADDTCLVR